MPIDGGNYGSCQYLGEPTDHAGIDPVGGGIHPARRYACHHFLTEEYLRNGTGIALEKKKPEKRLAKQLLRHFLLLFGNEKDSSSGEEGENGNSVND